MPVHKDTRVEDYFLLCSSMTFPLPDASAWAQTGRLPVSWSRKLLSPDIFSNSLCKTSWFQQAPVPRREPASDGILRAPVSCTPPGAGVRSSATEGWDCVGVLEGAASEDTWAGKSGKRGLRVPGSTCSQGVNNTSPLCHNSCLSPSRHPVHPALWAAGLAPARCWFQMCFGKESKGPDGFCSPFSSLSILDSHFTAAVQL